MSKKQKSTGSSVNMVSLPVVNPQTAGIDVSSRFHMVAVGQDKDADVKEFGVTTPDLHTLCQYLQGRNIQKVVMESTGYYWIPLFWSGYAHALLQPKTTVFETLVYPS
jgi:transposase